MRQQRAQHIPGGVAERWAVRRAANVASLGSATVLSGARDAGRAAPRSHIATATLKRATTANDQSARSSVDLAHVTPPPATANAATPIAAAN